MRKRQDDAAYLESQADRLEQFVDFGQARPAVFPKLKPSTARLTFRIPSWLLDELTGRPTGATCRISRC